MSQAGTHQDKKYWRSLERLLDSPALRDQLAGEFPEGAVDPPSGMSRRSLLKLMGASFALAGLASCRRPEEAIVPFVKAPEDLVPGVPKQYATTMPFGTSAYGVLVESHEGRPTKVEGNRLHPSSQGAASSWMQAAILDLYDPDRSPRVLERVDGNFHASTWARFIDSWQRTASEMEASGGTGLAVLVEAYSSPALSRLAALFQERFPKARWVVYEPVGDENLFEGLRLATGKAYRPVYHLEKAKRMLALDSDFLSAESESVRSAKGFAAGRKVTSRGDEMNRLYVVESTMSLTGANADHRLALRSAQIPALCAALALELRDLGLPLDLPREVSPLPLPRTALLKLKTIARDLARWPGQALVLAGRRQPPELHALVFAVNRAIGALGRTFSLGELRDVGWGKTSDLCALVEEMNQGRTSTLVLLGGNPAYNAPADLDFEEALQRVKQTIQLSTGRNETSRLADWHLPQAHFLEAWGDARSREGLVSIIQPLIAPLFEARSLLEVLGVLVRDQASDGFGLVRDAWLGGVLGDEDVEARWNRALHDGILEAGTLPLVTATLEEGAAERAFTALLGAPPANESEGFEIVFTPSHAVFDGRFANNGWLQELPDPVTKLTWDNAVLVSPGTAGELQIKTGDRVRLELRGRQLEAPVFVLPGQADGSVALALGYGRTAAGRVGDGVGVNAYLLRHSKALHFDGGLRIQPTRRSHPFAQTQEHWEMEGRDLVREASLDEYRQGSHFASRRQDEPRPLPLWQEHSYSEGYQWGMAIDLGACVGCNACVTACQAENNTPIVGKEQVARGREMHWLRVDRYFAGAASDPEVVFQPVPCMHCENAPCEQVCPVAATVHDREGLNSMVYNRCIGTRYCSNNCPYKVRRFNFFNYTKDLPETVRMAMNPDVTVRSRGVMEKCTYCVQRINETKIKAKQAGRSVRDGEIQTACQQTCPTEAIVFGDINDLESRVTQLKGQDRNYVLLEELHHKPRTSYLAKLRNPNPEWQSIQLD
ncbi:MAG: TAT-variant-translocated molybdopterin oxidoreductase [Acidobacteriota bacterium]